MPSAIADIATVNVRPNELFFGHAAIVDGEPLRIKVSSNMNRKSFRNMFGGGDTVVVKNGNCHETPIRKLTRRQESDGVSDAQQMDSGRQHSEKGLRREQGGSHFTSQEDRHRVFEPMTEGYRRAEQTKTRSSDGDTSGGHSSRTAWNNRKEQHVSPDKRHKRHSYESRKTHEFVTSDSEAESDAQYLTRTSDSESGSRERYRNDERVRRIRTSKNSDSEQSGHVVYSNKKRRHRVTKRYSDHGLEGGTSRNHNSRDELPPFSKEPVPTSSRRRQLPNKGQSSHKSRDSRSCDLYRVHNFDRRQICCNRKAAEDGPPWDTRVAPSPSWPSRSEHSRGTDYDDVTTSDEREFYDAVEEAVSNDEEYVYW